MHVRVDESVTDYSEYDPTGVEALGGVRARNRPAAALRRCGDRATLDHRSGALDSVKC